MPQPRFSTFANSSPAGHRLGAAPHRKTVTGARRKFLRHNTVFLSEISWRRVISAFGTPRALPAKQLDSPANWAKPVSHALHQRKRGKEFAMVAQSSPQFAIVDTAVMPSRSDRAKRFRSRDLLPWADPYIASLIRRLQAEVRAERAGRPPSGRFVSALDIRRSPVRSEAERCDPRPDKPAPDFDGRDRGDRRAAGAN
jgi:hypothetical protein